MQRNSRMWNSVYNLLSGFGFRILGTITSFLVRTVFIRCLSADYLGINGLYSNILSMLSLTELGFGTAMIYSMYKPLAENDFYKLAQLLELYKTVYRIVGSIVLGLGLALIPFMDYLIKDAPDIQGLTFYYVLFLLNSVTSYWFFSYRNSILQADQKVYVLIGYQSIFNIIKTVLQIVLLLVFHNYTIYLLTQIGCTIAQNIAVAYRVQKDYPYALCKPYTHLPSLERKQIFRDVRALMLQRITFVILNGTDNIIISAFVGVNWVGILSNYMIIVEAVTGILCQITSSISASLGNFFVENDADRGYEIFRRVEFLNFWLYAFSAIALMVLLDPFINIWLGSEYMLGRGVALALSIRFFVEGYMNTISVFRSTLGLFAYGQVLPLVAATVNVILSIALSYNWGVAGVLIATPISRLLVQVWYNPLLIHRKGFHRSVRPFYARYALRVMLMVVAAIITMKGVGMIVATGVTVASFAFAVVVVAVIPNLIFLAAFFRTEEFAYFADLLHARVMKR